MRLLRRSLIDLTVKRGKNMADEYKEIAETNDGGNSKKKKIIIGVVIAVVVVAVIAVVCAFSFGGGKEEYTDTPVSEEATSQLKPGVENGVFVDSVPNNNSNGTVASGSDNSGSSSGSQSGNSGSSGSSGSTNSSGSSGDSDSSNNSGSSGGSGSSDSGSDENVARQMEVYIVLPNDNNVSDNLFVYINGELMNEEGIPVTLNGQTYYCVTSDSYTGSVTVEARLENYGTSAKQISNATATQISVALPLDSSEENHAPGI